MTAADYGQPRLAEAMLHSDYPLQALLYCVVLHRFLRWRQPGYSPRAASGRRAVPVRARHVWRADAGRRRASGGRVQLAAARLADRGDVRSARRGDGGRMTTRGVSTSCSNRRMCMSHSGSPRWRRSPTSRSRWRWRSRCARCAAGRCAWTCGRSPNNSRCLNCHGRRRMTGWPPCRRARSSPGRRCCDCIRTPPLTCCTWTATGSKSSRCARTS